MVDLRKCKEGDYLLSKNGMILTYVGPLPPDNYFNMDHEVRYSDGSQGTRTHDGFTFRLRHFPEDHDIVDILPQKDESIEVLPPEALLTDEEIEEMDKVLEASKDESTEASKDESTRVSKNDEGTEAMEDVRIGLRDVRQSLWPTHIHLATAVIKHIPNVSDPEFVEIVSPLFTLRLPYHSINYIYANWSKGIKTENCLTTK